MRLRTVAGWGTAAALAFGAAMAVAYDSKPPGNHTAAPAIGSYPAEKNCNRCHGGNALNTGGAVELLDAPTAYIPGHTYTLRVRVSSSQTATNSGRTWGFEVTAIRKSDGTGGGTFAAVVTEGTAIRAGSGSYASRSYALQDSKDYVGAAGPVEWKVSWTAPPSNAGAITFYFTGLAGDGSGDNHDWVYIGTFDSDVDTTPTQATSLGALRARYR